MSQRRKDWILANKERILSKQFNTDISSTFINTIYDNRELKILHGTYQYELQMMEYVRTGNTPALRDLLLGYTDSETYEEGTVAKDDLRQVKNIFIALVAMAGKTAAIPGGVPVEQAYHLIDVYTQRCEELNTAEDVYSLQYSMLIDFSERVADYRYGLELSPLIRSCTNFIIFHLNEPLSSSDVIEFSGKSRSYISDRFKKETGYEIGTFITKCKIDEAKSLLRYSSKPIPEISAYLSFSSQPYFHNVFKKVTGMTPLQYRESRT